MKTRKIYETTVKVTCINDVFKVSFLYLKSMLLPILRELLKKWDGDFLVELTVAFYLKMQSKSLPQMRYYRGVVLPIYTDYCNEHERFSAKVSKSFIHGFLKQKCKYDTIVIDKLTGEVFYERRSLEAATMQEMSAFIDECIRHANSEGCLIPEPEKLQNDIIEITD